MMRMITLIVMILFSADLMTASAQPKGKKKHTTPQKTSSNEIPLTVKVFTPRFVQPNHVNDYKVPFKVKVNADDAATLSNIKVRARIFPNKTLTTVKLTYLELTQAGCHILRTRVEPYFPTFGAPDIEVKKIYPFEMKCDDDGKYLEMTPFVLVVESDDGDENRFLQIRPGATMDAYFRKAYTFRVDPGLHQPCPTIATGGGMVPSTPDNVVAFERQDIAEHDANRNSCVITVKQPR